MAKIDTLFMTKTAEKPYPLGPLYSPYKGVTPLGDGGGVGISVNISERLSANQRALYASPSHVLSGHNTDRSIRVSIKKNA